MLSFSQHFCFWFICYLFQKSLLVQRWLTYINLLNNHKWTAFSYVFIYSYSKWREKKAISCFRIFLWNHVVSYLQCTTMGPASGGLQAFTRLRKARNGVGCSGTPWSGQAVNWNCLTSLFSLEPFWIWRWRKVSDHHVSPQLLDICYGAQVAVVGKQHPNASYFKKCKCPDTVRCQLYCV